MRRRPKLGQHFLSDGHYQQRIADALSFVADEPVVEIGAGQGAMTELLAERAHRVIAVELDADLVAMLREKFRSNPIVEVTEEDILSVDVAEICQSHGAEQCFVFGNLPYYITSPIVRHLFAFRARIRAMALLVQREVAERLTAVPGTRDYGYLSVLAQFYTSPRILFSVPPGAFSPAPKVHSALVAFSLESAAPLGHEARNQKGAGLALPGKHAQAVREPPRSAPPRRERSTILAPEQEDDFLDFVKRCFAHKRKNLLNNLSGLSGRSGLSGPSTLGRRGGAGGPRGQGGRVPRERIAQELDRLGLPASARAEQLSVRQFVSFYQAFRRQKTGVRSQESE